MTKHERDVFTKVVGRLEEYAAHEMKNLLLYDLCNKARKALSNAERWEPVEFIGSDGAQVSKWEDRWQLWYPEKGMAVVGKYDTPEAAFETERKPEVDTGWIKHHMPNLGPYHSDNPRHCVDCGRPWIDGAMDGECVPVENAERQLKGKR